MTEYLHKDTAFKAVRVARPYINVSRAFPLTHRINTPSGRFDYFQVLDRPGGKVQRAIEGDWVVKYERHVLVLTDDEFKRNFQV